MYRDPDRLLAEQFTDRLTDNGMTDEILREVTTLENIEATSEHKLSLECKVEAQRTQRSTPHNIKESKDFDAILHNTQMWVHGVTYSDKCKY